MSGASSVPQIQVFNLVCYKSTDSNPSIIIPIWLRTIINGLSYNALVYSIEAQWSCDSVEGKCNPATPRESLLHNRFTRTNETVMKVRWPSPSLGHCSRGGLDIVMLWLKAISSYTGLIQCEVLTTLPILSSWIKKFLGQESKIWDDSSVEKLFRYPSENRQHRCSKNIRRNLNKLCNSQYPAPFFIQEKQNGNVVSTSHWIRPVSYETQYPDTIT